MIDLKNKPLIIIAGPTACGKTAVSVELAKEIGGEIISADSMQVYKYMDIGTAKITPREMQGIKHYMVDELDPREDFSVGVFKNKAAEYIGEIYAKGKIPIIAGGTGFYINAVLYGSDFSEETSDKRIREELQSFLKEKGAEALYARLMELDPDSRETIHINNTKRVIRAIEYYEITGEPISRHNKREKAKEPCYDGRLFVLNMDREKLYKRIDRRVDLMLEQGLLEEVRALSEKYNRGLVSMQGLGYKELIAYLMGECSLEEAVYKIKRDTRHFAKRQLTWFRHQCDGIWIDVEELGFDPLAVAKYIAEKL